MFDYGWIEDEKTGKRVWEIKQPETKPAGGAPKKTDDRRQCDASGRKIQIALQVGRLSFLRQLERVSAGHQLLGHSAVFEVKDYPDHVVSSGGTILT